MSDRESEETPPKRLAEALAAPVHQGERYVPFGELTVAEVEQKAEELGSVGGWGPLQRAAKVGRAWAALGMLMRERGAATVSELDPQSTVSFAEHTWALPPESGLI